MKSQTAFRLLKAFIFIVLVLLHKIAAGILIEVFFALVLAMYLLELYRRNPNVLVLNAKRRSSGDFMFTLKGPKKIQNKKRKGGHVKKHN